MKARRFFALVALLLASAVGVLGQERFSVIKEAASEIDFVGDQGIGEGAVADTFEAFWFDLEEDSRLTMQVLVTEEREGVRFTDDDSMLFLFDSRGRFIVGDDDGGPGATSRIDEVLLEGGERYYAIVTTFPNEPEISEAGLFDFLDDLGSSNIAFELHLRRLQEGEDGRRLMGALTSGGRGMELLTPGRPLPIESGSGSAEGIVSSGQEVFSFRIAEPSEVSLEVIVTDIYQGSEFRDDDSMLFLFTGDGILVAQDDDGGEGNASALRTTLQEPGRYYAVVTTYDNTPELDQNDRILRFPGTGKSSIRFVLQLQVRGR